MAEKFSFFDPVQDENGLFDREYNAQEFTDYFATLVTTGVMKGAGNQLGVSADGASMQTKLNTGVAFVEGRYYANDSVLTHTHDTEVVGKDRIDRIVIRLDLSTEARYVKSFVKKGVASTSPVAPSLTQTANIYEISVAQVKVIGGQTFISTGNVTDERGTAIICPWAGSKILPSFDDNLLAQHANNTLLHKQGLGIVQTGDNSNAEGRNTTASGIASHAEGYKSKAIGYASHAEGGSTSANKDYSHAEGFNTNTNGINSHAEGAFTSANGDSSHAEGEATLAQGLISHAEGYESVSAGKFSHAGGYGTIATPYASRAIGRYNKAMTGDSVNFNKTSDAYVIGNGLTTDARSNAFRVTFEGKVYGMAAFNSTGADYAEYFEWADGNSELEERQGYFVTLEDDKIRKATSSDDYILGIVSVNPSVIGDSHQDDWNDKYMTDEWGRIQYHYVDVPEEKDSEGRVIQKARQDYVPILNPNWNHNEEYIPREQRKEWSPVGIVGKLLVRDDGTCEVNGFCKSNDEGIATSSTDGYRVMKRVSENIVQVFIK